MPKAKQSASSEGLTPKEQMFIAEYLIDGNGTRAALAAGYVASNARKSASEALKRPRVQAALKAAKAKLLNKLELSAAKVLEDIERISNKAERAREFSAALKGKELLGKHLALFTERHELTGKNGGPIETKRSAAEFTDDELALIAAGKAGQ
jgi:hypothetical protein